MGCGCKKRREKIVAMFNSAAKKLRDTRSQSNTPAQAHGLGTKPKSVGLK